MRLFTLFLLTSPGLAGLLASDQAQDQQERQRQQETRGTSARSDGVLATWLLVGNENEVELAQFAQDRAQDPQVKQFAQMMVSDHRQMAQKLQPIAATVGYEGKEPGLAGGGQSRPREASAMRPGGELDYVALIQELGEQHLSSARKELQSKQGAEFDKAFMGLMVAEHMGMHDKMVVFQRHASGELKNEIQQGEDKVRSHLEKAKQVMKSIDDGGQGGK